MVWEMKPGEARVSGIASLAKSDRWLFEYKVNGACPHCGQLLQMTYQKFVLCGDPVPYPMAVWTKQGEELHVLSLLTDGGSLCFTTHHHPLPDVESEEMPDEPAYGET